MYGHDTRRKPRMTSCPICYCMVEEKFMSMHIMWHEETDPKEDYSEEPTPAGRFEYEL